MRDSPDICPNCGAEVPAGSKACPECGSDETTGWSDEAHADRLGLPDENFSYDDFVEREFGGKRAGPPRGIRWYWWLVAIGLLIAFLLAFK